MSQIIKIQDIDIAVSYKKGWELAIGTLEEHQKAVTQIASLNPQCYGAAHKKAVHKAKVKI